MGLEQVGKNPSGCFSTGTGESLGHHLQSPRLTVSTLSSWFLCSSDRVFDSVHGVDFFNHDLVVVHISAILHVLQYQLICF